jgi:hypothetical protein
MHSDDHPWILARPTAPRDPDAVAAPLALSADFLREGKIDSVSDRTGFHPGDHRRNGFRVVDAGGARCLREKIRTLELWSCIGASGTRRRFAWSTFTMSGITG